jgi:hypothetical protein
MNKFRLPIIIEKDSDGYFASRIPSDFMLKTDVRNH